MSVGRGGGANSVFFFRFLCPPPPLPPYQLNDLTKKIVDCEQSKFQASDITISFDTKRLSNFEFLSPV